MFDRFLKRNRALDDEAIERVIQLGREPTATMLAAMEAWCTRSPAHAEAVRRARRLLEDIGRTESAQEHAAWTRALAPQPGAPRLTRRRLLAGGAAAASVAALGGVASSGMLFGPPAGWLADQSTAVGQRRRVVLPDGSWAWLNTASALSLAYTAQHRRVNVDAGEVLFEVAEDVSRPFQAGWADGWARTGGGSFLLRREAGHAVLAALSATVALRCAAGELVLQPGQRVAFSAEVMGGVETADVEALAAWTRNKLIFNRQPVAAIAAELQRYSRARIVVMGPALRTLQLSGVFALDEPAALLRSVADLAGAQLLELPMLYILR